MQTSLGPNEISICLAYCGCTGIPRTRAQVKSLLLLFGMDCWCPSESTLMSPSLLEPTELTDYHEELVYHCLWQGNWQLHTSRKPR